LSAGLLEEADVVGDDVGEGEMGGDGDEPGVKADPGEIEFNITGGKGKKVESGEAVGGRRRKRALDENGRGVGQGDTAKKGEGENEGDN
jgi:hypothetical protein